jgi:2-amino-4-hydroxy-6-hydroxymethyldihydropteridine diphosphokinase
VGFSFCDGPDHPIIAGKVKPGPILAAPILVAVGANLPGPEGRAPLETCRWAAGALDALPGLRLVALSRWYRTPPDPPSDQPWYINAVARLAGAADPAALLAALHALEAAAGRRRSGEANAARPLDLDLIAIGGLVRDAPDPVLPHPRAHRRGFVMAPLAEVAPGWLHPRLHRSAQALAAALPAPEPLA